MQPETTATHDRHRLSFANPVAIAVLYDLRLDDDGRYWQGKFHADNFALKLGSIRYYDDGVGHSDSGADNVQFWTPQFFYAWNWQLVG